MSRFFVVFLSVAASTAAFAQADGSSQTLTLRDPGQKTFQVTRTDTPPVIDGVLDEAVWELASLVDDLHQTIPIEYSEPTQHTEVRVLYDDDALYVGVTMFDTNAEGIVALNLRQNDQINADDRIFITLDPFNDQRSGYFFGLNPNSVRQDGLYQNVTEFYSDWDGIFDGRSSIFDGGWIAEFEIPFKTISFDPTTDTWGINFTRTVARNSERMAWVSRNRQFGPSASGLAVGFEGMNQGVGLDIVPSLISRRSKIYDGSDSDSDFEPQLDVAYRLTPSLNASLTINTDFSATEVDDRQVNLTRFGLFFPEKRDFFLREADIFEFGNIGINTNTLYGFGSGRQNGRPFFSRRIGLSPAGQPVDLEYGTKLSGRVGDWELGFMSIRQDEFATAEADTLTVARARLGILRESSVGIIATEGNPNANIDNSLTGFDFIYRNSRLPGGRRLETDVWYQSSDTEGLEDDDAAFGVGVRIPSNEGFRGGAQYRRYEENFNPALGFLVRGGITDVGFDVGYTLRPRTGPIQSYLASFDAQRIERIDGSLQSQQFNVRWIDMRNHANDRVFLFSRARKENLIRPFEISPGIVVPVGEYDFSDYRFEFTSSNFRKFSGEIGGGRGSFFSGNRTNMNVLMNWRPSPKFNGRLSYNYSDVDLPQGQFETRLVSMGLDFVFSSQFSWVNLIQYDNVTETVGINMRLHWIPEAGRELFFVINHNLTDFLDRDNSFESQQADVTIKYSHTFRF